MLRAIPGSLLPFAVDGVVPASALEKSTELRQLGRYARKRAHRQLEQAAQQADELHAQALDEGYRRGMLLAWQSLWPVAEALQQEQSALRRAIWQEVGQALRSIATDSGVAAAQIEAACAQWAASADGPAPILHLPMEQQPLAEALRNLPTLAGVDIRLARREHPALEVGHMVYELDLEAALSAAAEEALDRHMPQLEAACSELARFYSREVQDAAVAAAAAQRFSSLRTWA